MLSERELNGGLGKSEGSQARWVSFEEWISPELPRLLSSGPVQFEFNSEGGSNFLGCACSSLLSFPEEVLGFLGKRGYEGRGTYSVHFWVLGVRVKVEASDRVLISGEDSVLSNTRPSCVFPFVLANARCLLYQNEEVNLRGNACEVVQEVMGGWIESFAIEDRLRFQQVWGLKTQDSSESVVIFLTNQIVFTHSARINPSNPDLILTFEVVGYRVMPNANDSKAFLQLRPANSAEEKWLRSLDPAMSFRGNSPGPFEPLWLAHSVLKKTFTTVTVNHLNADRDSQEILTLPLPFPFGKQAYHSQTSSKGFKEPRDYKDPKYPKNRRSSRDPKYSRNSLDAREEESPSDIKAFKLRAEELFEGKLDQFLFAKRRFVVPITPGSPLDHHLFLLSTSSRGTLTIQITPISQWFGGGVTCDFIVSWFELRAGGAILLSRRSAGLGGFGAGKLSFDLEGGGPPRVLAFEMRPPPGGGLLRYDFEFSRGRTLRARLLDSGQRPFETIQLSAAEGLRLRKEGVGKKTKGPNEVVQDFSWQVELRPTVIEMPERIFGVVIALRRPASIEISLRKECVWGPRGVILPSPPGEKICLSRETPLAVFLFREFENLPSASLLTRLITDVRSSKSDSGPLDFSKMNEKYLDPELFVFDTKLFRPALLAWARKVIVPPNKSKSAKFSTTENLDSKSQKPSMSAMSPPVKSNGRSRNSSARRLNRYPSENQLVYLPPRTTKPLSTVSLTPQALNPSPPGSGFLTTQHLNASPPGSGSLSFPDDQPLNLSSPETMAYIRKHGTRLQKMFRGSPCKITEFVYSTSERVLILFENKEVSLSLVQQIWPDLVNFEAIFDSKTIQYEDSLLRCVAPGESCVIGFTKVLSRLSSEFKSRVLYKVFEPKQSETY